jgi:hypothetical protein
MLIDEPLIDKGVREIVLAPQAIITIVDPGQSGSHARRTRHASFAVDKQDFYPVPDLLNEVQEFRGMGLCECIRSVRVRGVGEYELQ